MPSCNIGDPPIVDLLDRYDDRIEARVAERDGGRFDIALTVGGLEIACIRMRGASPGVLLYRDHADQPAALDGNGHWVPLPTPTEGAPNG